MHSAYKTGCACLATILCCLPLLLPAQSYPAPYRKGKLWGYADPGTGQIIIPPSLDSVGLFRSEGVVNPLAWVKKGARYGLVNRSGALVLPIKEYMPWPITRVAPGFFAVERLALGAGNQQEEANLAYITPGLALRATTYFDKNGRLIGAPFALLTILKRSYYEEEGSWQDPNNFGFNTAPSFRADSIHPVIWKDGKVGLFDLEKGQIVIQPVWNAISTQGPVAVARRWETEGPEAENVFKTVLIDLVSGVRTEVPDVLEIMISPAAGEPLLTRNRATKLFGYLDKKAKVLIPFTFQQANPFSANGFTKVLSKAGVWSVIDKTGREIYRIGKYNGFMFLPDGSIWKQADADARYYKIPPATGDSSTQIGLDFPPQLLKFADQSLYVGQQLGKTGLLTTTGIVVLPFDFDYIYPGFTTSALPQDSLLRKQFFTVSKNNRRWMFDGHTLQPVWPKIVAGNGLQLGETFEQSNFDLLPPIAGDSLFVIQLADMSNDLLNIRSGVRWNVSNARSFYINPAENAGPLLYYNPIRNDLPAKRYTLNGQAIPWTTGGYTGRTPGFGSWSSGYDPTTGLQILMDSAGRVLCEFKVPFGAENNSVHIQENYNGSRMPFVVVVSSEEEFAVFSLAGRLLSPPGISAVYVTNDFLFAAVDGKWGAYTLVDGQKILPFAYKYVAWRNGKLSAFDFEGTERQFDLRGKLLVTYPRGYASVDTFKNGLQVVQHDCNTNYLNEQLRLAFPADSILQARSFAEGLGAVKIFDLGWKYIRPTGRPAFNGYFFYAESFKNGRAIVRTPDGWTQLIDTLGHPLLQIATDPLAGKPALARLGKNYLLRQDSQLQKIITLTGQPVLKNCSCIQQNIQSDTIPFYCDKRLGRLLPDGRILWVEKSDFVSEKDPYRGARSVLKGFNCTVEGLLHPQTGAWVVEPKASQEIRLPEDLPQWAYVSDLTTQIKTVVDRYSGAVIPVDPSNLQRLEGELGWLYTNDETKTGVLYSPDLKTKRSWNYRYKDIRWRQELELAEVYNGENQLVGYLSKSGRLLFED